MTILAVFHALADAAAEQAPVVTISGAIGAVIATVAIKILTAASTKVDAFFSSGKRPIVPTLPKGQFRRVFSLLETLTARQIDCMEMQKNTSKNLDALVAMVGKLTKHVEFEEAVRNKVAEIQRGRA